MVKRKKPLFRNAASGIARKWAFLHFTLILITTDMPKMAVLLTRNCLLQFGPQFSFLDFAPYIG